MNATQESSFGKALYYPYIHIQDSNWLKLSLLYFDGIRRIIPSYTPLQDSPVIRRVVDEGLLEATAPESYRDAAEKKFREDVLSLLEQETPEAATALRQASWAFSQNQVSTELLHLEKMTYDLPGKLEEFGLARKVGDWLEVDAYVAGSYMMCLATVMSNEIQAPLITDTPGYGGLGEYLAFGQPTERTHKGLSNILLKLNVDFPDPKSLANVSIENILDFHHKRSDERKRFRQAIESINIAANQIDDLVALNDFFSQHQKDIKSAIEDHQKTLDELKVKLIGSLLSVSTPTAIATVTGLTIPPVAIGLTGTGIAISLVKWWAEVRGGHRETAKKSPWHYLLSVQQFTPKTPFGTRLWTLRQKAIAMGESLLTAKELEQELAERRGGYSES